MGYSKEVFSAVAARLSERRQKARYIAEKRREELYEKAPELIELERQLNAAGLEAARAMVLGGEQNAEELVLSLAKKAEELTAEKLRILSALGFDADYLDTPYTCKLCSDSGYMDGRLCDCMKNELRLEAYSKLNAMSALRLSSFDQFDLGYYPAVAEPATGVVPRTKMTEIYDYCLKYAESFSDISGNILMMGATGLGKTHLSLAIAAAAIEKGYGVIYGSAQNILSALEREHFGRDETGGEFLSSLFECDLLILDDLGSEFQTSFTSAAIYNIINSRLLTRKPTIISTNLTFEGIQSAYSEKVLSRLGGSYSFLRFFGSDIRQIQRKLQGG